MTAAATATGAVLVPQSTLRCHQEAPADAPTLLHTAYPGGRAEAEGGGETALDDDERAPTSPYLPPVFFGQRVPCWPADKPLPAHVVIGSTDATRLERSPRPVSR